MKSKIKNKVLAKVGERWNQISKEATQRKFSKTRWWQFAQIKDHISKRIYHNDKESGFISAAINKYKILPCEKAVSIGCGNAKQEIELLELGLVKHFDLYEVSTDRISEAKSIAEAKGVLDRIDFFQVDFLSEDCKKSHYDLVYWNNSLHHMFNVNKSLQWTKKTLKTGGGLMVDDFIGPSRFQWSSQQLEYASKVRECFVGTKYLDHPYEDRTLPTTIKRPSKTGMIRADPSEAADSSNIMKGLKKHFPDVEVFNTGGVIYHLALNDVLANFNEEEDQHLIKLLMVVDDLLSDNGDTHYAVAFAIKK